MLRCAVVGAGVAGLSLARALTARGIGTVVLERARGVGGRCATRRVDGRPVDHGVAYLHGRSDRFRSELDSLDGSESIPGWPRANEGGGVPCQPEAFDPDAIRLGLRSGVNLFAKRLAQGLDVRLRTEVVALKCNRGWDLELSSGDVLRAETIVLAMPAPSAIALLRTAPSLPATIAALIPLLELIRMLPCLTVIARYPESVVPPGWEASFPATGDAIHTLLHDSSKRLVPHPVTLVVQARPAFSREHMDQPSERWTEVLIREAAALHGTWAARPEVVQPHVWRHARVDAPSRLAAPLLVRAASGCGLGFAGDGFHREGGLEGAFLSGLGLAERIAAAMSSMDPAPRQQSS